MRLRLVLVLGLIAAAAALLVPIALAQRPAPRGTEAILIGRDGQTLGRVAMERRASGGVEVRYRVRGLPPAEYKATHVHEVGTCDRAFRTPDGTPAPFESAGGHWNPRGASHSSHPGDFPPLQVSGGGTAEVAFVTDRFQPSQLLDVNGSAVVIHLNRDNQGNVPGRYRSEPADQNGPDATTLATGDAGGRLACGVVRPIRR
jgi:Cu-Zn family superoxide dismutase